MGVALIGSERTGSDALCEARPLRCRGFQWLAWLVCWKLTHSACNTNVLLPFFVIRPTDYRKITFIMCVRLDSRLEQ